MSNQTWFLIGFAAGFGGWLLIGLLTIALAAWRTRRDQPQTIIYDFDQGRWVPQ